MGHVGTSVSAARRLTTPMSDNLPKKTIHFTKTAFTMQNIVIRGAICL